MRKIRNDERINEITISGTIYPFCPLGKATYKAEVLIWFEPIESYMDYCEITQFMQSLNGSELTIEKLAEVIYNEVAQFKPISQSVVIDAESNKHFPVTVRKE